MRILFFTDNFPPETNAPATRTWDHVRVWATAGHQVTVITTAPNFPRGKVFDGYRNDWRSVEVREGVRIVRVKTYIAANQGTARRMLDYLSFMASGTIASLFEKRPDVIVATSPQFFTAVAGWFVSILRWRPWVFELRDLWPASVVAVGAMRESRALRAVEKLELFLYHRAARVIAVTQAFRADLIDRGIDGGKISVVSNGVDLAAIQPADPDPEIGEQLGTGSGFTIAYIGTHGMAHALDRVLDAAEHLAHRPDVRFLFVGDGAERDGLERRARDLPQVHFLGAQPRERIPALWALADAALVSLRNTPTFETVIPSKIYEAMAVGTPVIASLPEGEATRLVKHHGIGLICPPEDPEALAETIAEMADQPNLRAELGKAALAAAPAYSRSELAQQMLGHLIAVAKDG
ncbi:MAG: glycosyltransferase family 4 protein [Pseudomonadota bacterium]